MSGRPQDPVERFWRYVDRAGTLDCWLWTGGRQGSGYGQFSRPGGRNIGAHRWSWEHHNSRPIPDGLIVMHTCDVKLCVNPAHLRIGTIADNNWDKTLKGRNPGNRIAGGRQWGRKVDDRKAQAMRAMSATGEPYHQIASRFGVSAATVCRNIGRMA